LHDFDRRLSDAKYRAKRKAQWPAKIRRQTRNRTRLYRARLKALGLKRANPLAALPAPSAPIIASQEPEIATPQNADFEDLLDTLKRWKR